MLNNDIIIAIVEIRDGVQRDNYLGNFMIFRICRKVKIISQEVCFNVFANRMAIKRKKGAELAKAGIFNPRVEMRLRLVSQYMGGKEVNDVYMINYKSNIDSNLKMYTLLAIPFRLASLNRIKKKIFEN